MYDHFDLVNLHQTLAERKLKYSISRMAGLSWQEAQRLRDWHWSELTGFLIIALSRRGGDPEAIKEVCENVYQIFKGISRLDDHPG